MQRKCLNWKMAAPALAALIVFFIGALHAQALAQEKEPDTQPPPTVALTGFGEVALSPDGKWVAASGAPGTPVRLWDTATGKEIAVLTGHDSEVMLAVSSPEGKRLCTATTKEVRIWEVATGKQLQRIPAGPNWQHHQMTLSGDEKWFVSAPDMKQESTPDGRYIMASLHLWEVGTAKEVRRFEIVRSTAQLLGDYATYFSTGAPVTNEIPVTALSHDGKWVVGGTLRGVVHLWEAATGKEIRSLSRSKEYAAIPVGFSRDDKWLATRAYPVVKGEFGPPVVRLWDVATGEEKHAIKGDVFEASFSKGYIFEREFFGRWQVADNRP